MRVNVTWEEFSKITEAMITGNSWFSSKSIAKIVGVLRGIMPESEVKLVEHALERVENVQFAPSKDTPGVRLVL